MRARSFMTLEVDVRIRDAVVGALAPEVRSPPEGTEVIVQGCGKAGTCIMISVESDDASNHRAAINSYLGLLQATIASMECPLEKNKYEEQSPP